MNSGKSSRIFVTASPMMVHSNDCSTTVPHFDREVIVLCVRWFLRYKFSLRGFVEMIS